MVHGTKLACDLARHLPIHRPGDSAAPRGDIGRGALRERSKAPKLRRVVARNAPLRAGALVAHDNPFDVSVGACWSMESQAQFDLEPAEPLRIKYGPKPWSMSKNSATVHVPVNRVSA